MTGLLDFRAAAADGWVMLTPAAPASTRSQMAATARRYDAATARIAAPATRRGTTDVENPTVRELAGYRANASVSLSDEAGRGSLIDVLA